MTAPSMHLPALLRVHISCRDGGRRSGMGRSTGRGNPRITPLLARAPDAFQDLLYQLPAPLAGRDIGFAGAEQGPCRAQHCSPESLGFRSSRFAFAQQSPLESSCAQLLLGWKRQGIGSRWSSVPAHHCWRGVDNQFWGDQENERGNRSLMRRAILQFRVFPN